MEVWHQLQLTKSVYIIIIIHLGCTLFYQCTVYSLSYVQLGIVVYCLLLLSLRIASNLYRKLSFKNKASYASIVYMLTIYRAADIARCGLQYIVPLCKFNKMQFFYIKINWLITNRYSTEDTQICRYWSIRCHLNCYLRDPKIDHTK